MFNFPPTDKVLGADLHDSPVTLNPQFRDGPEPITEFVIPVWKMLGWKGCTGDVGVSR